MKRTSEIRNKWFIDNVNQLVEKGISKVEIANKLGVLPQYLTPILKGNHNASENLAAKLIDVYNINQNALFDMAGTVEKDATVYGVPLISVEAIAGFGSGDIPGIRYEDCDLYRVPEFEMSGVEFVIRVSGSSMYPKYSNGDILACRKITDILFFQWGKVYVIDSSQGILIKRVFEHENQDLILLVSDNKEKYQPFPIPKSDIRSLSIVLGVIRME